MPIDGGETWMKLAVGGLAWCGTRSLCHPVPIAVWLAVQVSVGVCVGHHSGEFCTCGGKLSVFFHLFFALPRKGPLRRAYQQGPPFGMLFMMRPCPGKREWM